MGYYYQTSNEKCSYYVNLKTGEIKRELNKNDIEVEGFITDLDDANNKAHHHNNTHAVNIR